MKEFISTPPLLSSESCPTTVRGLLIKSCAVDSTEPLGNAAQKLNAPSHLVKSGFSSVPCFASHHLIFPHSRHFCELTLSLASQQTMQRSQNSPMLLRSLTLPYPCPALPLFPWTVSLPLPCHICALNLMYLSMLLRGREHVSFLLPS